MSTPSNALVPTSVTLAGPKSGAVVRVEDFLPFNVDQMVARKEAMEDIIKRVLVKGTDYGPQPGARDDQSDVLKKPGAEKLMSTFGLSPQVLLEEQVEDWTGKDHGGEPFFYYRYKVALYHGDKFMGEAVGSCNSWEKKYRHRWVSEDEAKLYYSDLDKLPKQGGRKTIFEPNFALINKETTGKYGKPAAYWQQFEDAKKAGTAKEASRQMGKDKKDYEGWEITINETQYRIPNPNAPDLVNTIQKIAFKRGLVASILVVTNCSDAFTQDLEEDEETGRPAAAHDSEDPGAGMRGEPEKKNETKKPKDSGNIATKGTATGTTTATAGHSHTCQTCKKEWVCTLAKCDGRDRFMKCDDCARPVQPEQKPAEGHDKPNSVGVPRAIPEEMRLIIERFRVDPKQMVATTYQLIGDWFRKRGEAAHQAYEKEYLQFRNDAKASGVKVGIEDHVNKFLDFWELLKKFPEPEDW